jgi:hypothetical protein
MTSSLNLQGKLNYEIFICKWLAYWYLIDHLNALRDIPIVVLYKTECKFNRKIKLFSIVNHKQKVNLFDLIKELICLFILRYSLVAQESAKEDESVATLDIDVGSYASSLKSHSQTADINSGKKNMKICKGNVKCLESFKAFFLTHYSGSRLM